MSDKLTRLMQAKEVLEAFARAGLLTHTGVRDLEVITDHELINTNYPGTKYKERMAFLAERHHTSEKTIERILQKSKDIESALNPQNN